MDLDLNIDNYNLEELLNLFKLTTNFDKSDLKNAKKYVCKLHPDISNLPKEYFIFFAKAYKYIENIHDFRERKQCNVTEYDNLLDDNKKEVHEDIIKNISKKQHFNRWFNEMFEEYQIKDNDTGYEEWLKCNNSIQITDAKNISELQTNFNIYKASIMKDIVVHKEIYDVCNNLSCGGSNINRKTIVDYSSSDVFSNNLQYNDVKKAHTESFITVNEYDFNNKKQYKNEMELNIERSKNIHIPTMEESNQIIRNKRRNEETISSRDAYELIKHQERQNKKNELFMKNLRLLK
tara:strand:+ start:1882 stop:2757 length:876 start_codon:yes stop_codon:yes gene_type:complete